MAPTAIPAIPQYPRIAGQSERYVAHQMALIASGQRGGMAVAMVPFVQDLTPQDMRDIGAYFATQKAGAGLADDGLIADGAYKGMKFYEVGQQLYRGGDAARGIPACMACHGPSGAGNPGPAYPHVGGQHQDYVARRLQEYRTGTSTEKDPAPVQHHGPGDPRADRPGNPGAGDLPAGPARPRRRCRPPARPRLLRSRAGDGARGGARAAAEPAPQQS